MQGVSLFLVLACFGKYQYAVSRDDDLFLFGRNGRVLVLAQGFLDLLLDFEQGGVQRGCLVSDFWEVGNMGCAAVCRECAKHRVRLVFNRNAVLHVFFVATTDGTYLARGEMTFLPMGFNLKAFGYILTNPRFNLFAGMRNSFLLI